MFNMIWQRVEHYSHIYLACSSKRSLSYKWSVNFSINLMANEAKSLTPGTVAFKILLWSSFFCSFPQPSAKTGLFCCHKTPPPAAFYASLKDFHHQVVHKDKQASAFLILCVKIPNLLLLALVR